MIIIRMISSGMIIIRIIIRIIGMNIIRIIHMYDYNILKNRIITIMIIHRYDYDKDNRYDNNNDNNNAK